MRNIEDFAAVFVRHGLPITLGRAFGLILTSDEPLGLDVIARELELSKSAASRTLRDLEQLGVVRRRSTPGSKRIVFEPLDQGDALLRAFVGRLRDLHDVFDTTARGLAKGPAKVRLRSMAELYGFAVEEAEGILIKWRRRAS